MPTGISGGTEPPMRKPVAPPTLHETGLYLRTGTNQVDPAHLGFAPQYPLWTDGASKRRWISLPPGTQIDASDADAWEFPVGTRFWKEFAFDGRPVETRYMEHLPNGTWLFATYAWTADGTGAMLVGARGILKAHDLGEGRFHAIPAQSDCTACHMSGRSPVLGFAALQLSDDLDPGALHAEPAPAPGLRLRALRDRGLIAGLDNSLTIAPPRTSTASASQRTALGYFHGNCGHCHNPYGPLNRVGLFLRFPPDPGRAAALSTTLRAKLVNPPAGLLPGTHYRIKPGSPAASAIPQRMAARGSALQMPPLGTSLPDAAALHLINRWITETGMSRVPARPQESKRR